MGGSPLIADLKTNDPALRHAFEQALRQAEGTSTLLRNSNRFPLAGRGDVNTYPVFVELMANGVSPAGRVGAIVPTGIATDDTTKHFFASLIANKRIASLYDFENRGIFPAVHTGKKFCLITLTGSRGTAPQVDLVFFAHDPSDLDDIERRFFLSSQDFNLLNPNTNTCPIFRSIRDSEITKSIYRRLPVLVNENKPTGNPWNISFLTMFHMSNDSQGFRQRDWLESEGYLLEGNHFTRSHRNSEPSSHTTKTRKYVPLYEAKMVDLYDHRAADVYKSTTATTRQNQPRYLTVQQKQDPNRHALPLYWIDSSALAQRVDPTVKWLLGFNNVTGVTNERTTVCAALPPVAVGHSEPIISTTRHPELLLVILSSFVLDYAARQKVGGNNLVFGVVRQLPVPRLVDAQLHAIRLRRSVIELSYTAWDMAPFASDLGHDGPPFRWDEERRALIRAELDALMFHLYGMSREDTYYIMDTFPVVRRKDEDLHGEFRTKRLILDRYDAMTVAFEATHRTLAGTPNGPNPPLNQPSLTMYSRLLADALTANYRTNVDPPPAHPSQAHPASSRPSWASGDDC